MFDIRLIKTTYLWHLTFDIFLIDSCEYTVLDEEKDRSGMERNKMLITFNYQITLMEMKTENRDKIMSHEKPVTAAIYNSVYNQVRPIWQFSCYCKYTYIF